VFSGPVVEAAVADTVAADMDVADMVAVDTDITDMVDVDIAEDVVAEDIVGIAADNLGVE